MKHDSLQDNLQELVENGVIDSETAGRIRIYFEDNPTGERVSRSGMAVAALAIGGVCLLSSGAILLLAHNWDQLPMWLRLLLAFLPLAAGIAGAVGALRKPKNPVWRECACLLCLAGIATSQAQLSQYFGLTGTLESFLLFWSYLALLFIYALSSTLGMALLLAAVSVIAVSEPTLLNNALLIAWLAAPFLFFFWWWKRYTKRAAFLRYWALPLLPLWGCAFGRPDMEGIGYAMICAFLLCYTAGLSGRAVNIPTARNPWLFIPVPVLALLFAIVCIYPASNTSFAGGGAVFWVTLGLLELYQIRCWVVRRDPVILWNTLAPIAFLLYFVPSGWAQLALNFFVIAYGVNLFARGAKVGDLLRINGALLILAGLGVSWFFNADFGLTERGIAFILIGSVLLAVNWGFLKKRKRHDKEAANA